jgi:AcrR family transcriptional regulator
MSTPRLDPRIRHTRQRLHNALLALAEERPLDTITVQDITERAEVNRSTFYQHYRDRDDLVKRVLDQLFDELTIEVRRFVESDEPLTRDRVPPGIRAQSRIVRERAGLFRRLLDTSGSNAFVAQLRAYHEAQNLELWAKLKLTPLPGTPPIGMRASFIASSVQGMLQWWLTYGNDVDDETFSVWFWALLQPAWFEGTSKAVPDTDP